MNKQAIIDHLTAVAHLKAMGRANPFSVRAYQKAVEVLRRATELPEDPLAIEGIGDGIAGVIDEFVRTGTSQPYEVLSKKLPVEALTLTRVQGIGPMTALKLHGEGIRNYDELVAAAAAGKLNPKMTAAVRFAEETKAGRVPYELASSLGHDVLGVVKTVEGVLRASVAGSLRRCRTTIKDLDIVAAGDGRPVQDLFKSIEADLRAFELLREVVAYGNQKATLRVERYGVLMACDVWIVPLASFGAALCYATGSKEHNIRMRALAKERGWLLNEKGLFDTDGNVLASLEEENIYASLGVPYLEPRDREES